MTGRACSSCDTPVPDDAAFCPNCGAATPADLNVEFGEGFEERLSAAPGLAIRVLAVANVVLSIIGIESIKWLSRLSVPLLPAVMVWLAATRSVWCSAS